MKHAILGAICLASPLLLAACQTGPTAMIAQASNATSQLLCSAAFVSDIDPEKAYQAELHPEPGMSLIDWASRRTVDYDAKEARTTIFGSHSRAVYRDGRGCTLIHQNTPELGSVRRLPLGQSRLPDIAGAETIAPPSLALKQAIDAAFAEPAQGAPRATQAVVIVHNGRIIAEHYAANIGPDTPLNGHSLSKSAINALIGLLVKDGTLSVADKINAPEWSAPGDARAAITVDQLLRMSAGFDFDEGKGAGVASRFWYGEDDTAHSAALLPLVTQPGGAWHYSSGSYALLSRRIKQAIGGPQHLSDFARARLFGPLGMAHTTLTFDSGGNLMGAQAIYASPRDWARFGQLYLQNGKAGAAQILPENWPLYSTSPTAQSGYGAGFWINGVAGNVPQWGMPWGLPAAPKDAFMARGYMGQWIVIIPSRNLVVVRMGNSHDDVGARESVDTLIKDVVAALD